LARGNEGDAMLQNLFALSGNRINILGSADLTRNNKFLTKNPSAGLVIWGSFSHRDVANPVWKQIGTDGRIYNVNNVSLNIDGAEPLEK
jgi:hypothetical protein